MKSHVRPFLLLFIISLFIQCAPDKQAWEGVYPRPNDGTIIKLDMEDGEKDKKNKKKAWIELMHQSSPEVDWRSIEAENRLKKHQNKIQLRNSRANMDPENEIIVEGKLVGQWLEKGSLNQAGSVFDTEYDPDTDLIYLISAGGSLFKGARNGSYWEVINQDLKFSTKLLRIIKDESDTKVMVALINDEPHYSYDLGLSWTKSSGVEVAGRSYAKDPIYIDEISEIFMLSKRDWWSDINLYVSKDFGKTYQSIASFSTSDFDNIAICNPHGTGELYLIEQISNSSSNFFKYNTTNGNLDLLHGATDFSFGSNGRGNLDGIKVGEIVRHFAYDGSNNLYISEDEGASWQMKGTFPVRPWGVGMFVSRSNPDLLLIGDIECYRSLDGGESWTKINDWWEYYSNVRFDIHADMMYFNEFTSNDGRDFILISNHGGLSISYDETLVNENISLQGLNVSQYYSVRSHPLDNNWIFAGSQDQGFQRANSTDDGIANFEQVISGDYGHIVFAKDNTSLWTVYPGGWVTLYNDPQYQGYHSTWEVISDDESVWIPPLIPGPNPSENAILMAGGNALGGSGSHVIKLTHTPSSGITSTQFSFDFKAASGGEVSAMAYSPFDNNILFVATTNGRIYKSIDGGTSFQNKAINVAGAHYLYGSCILPSKLDPNVIYFSGSGYSTAPVIVSRDGGESWAPMREGMPSTMAFGIVANEDESLIFAATEAGPYVFVSENEEWYDLSGVTAPNQTYWTVEYLNDSKTARFGTYGRGIWDFRIKSAFASLESEQFFFNQCEESEFEFDISIGAGFVGDVDLSTTMLPDGINVNFEVNPATPGSVVTASVSLNDLPKDVYQVSILGSDGTNTDQLNISVNVSEIPSPSVLLEPSNEAINVSINPEFIWEGDNIVESYTIDITKDIDFTDIIHSSSLVENQFTLESIDLTDNTKYFWRITGTNHCGETISIIHEFTTTSSSSIQLLDLDEFNVYPNPTNGILHIEAKGFDQDDSVLIRLVSREGKLVLSRYYPVFDNRLDRTINVGDYPEGLYYLEIIQNQQFITKKILIQK